MQGQSGIRTKCSFNNNFPLSNFILFCTALTGGIKTGPIPVLPWQVSKTSLNPGKVITLVPSATTWMDFPWWKYVKDRRRQHPFPSTSLCLSAKGHTAVRLQAAAAGEWRLLLEPPDGFLTSRGWEGVWAWLCTSLNWQPSAGRNQALSCSTHDAVSERRFQHLGN